MTLYTRSSCAAFRKTKEAFGGFSNMAAGFPLSLLGLTIATSEALYQACRFPDHPELQRQILAEKNPMKAKWATKPNLHLTRPDWEEYRARVVIMEWALRVKLAQHTEKFGGLLLSSGLSPIVEDSYKDRFWGAVPTDTAHLEGENVLGKLLGKLREEVREGVVCQHVAPPLLPNFHFLGQPFEV